MTAKGKVLVETNLIYCGDNLEVLAKFPEKSVDLIYADPPFFSSKAYKIIWGNGAEQKAYEDRWKGGINVYIEWMKERLWQCYRVLKDTGSMYLHCDWHASHRLRVAMDDIFGERHFQNEIIWWYGGGGASKTRWAGSHDTLLFYTKSDKWLFNTDAVREPYKVEWTRGQRRADGSERTLKKGKLPDDVWRMHSLMPWAKERLKYPTQKPEALLKPIILASSNPDDIVLDPFCGCGTTLVVAHQLGRKWIGIDVSPIACELTKTRLEKTGASGIICFWQGVIFEAKMI